MLKIVVLLEHPINLCNRATWLDEGACAIKLDMFVRAPSLVHKQTFVHDKEGE